MNADIQQLIAQKLATSGQAMPGPDARLGYNNMPQMQLPNADQSRYAQFARSNVRTPEQTQAFLRARAQSLQQRPDYVNGMERDQQIRDTTMWHPRVMYQYLRDKIAGALGQ